MTRPGSLPSAGLSREEVAQREVGHTTASRSVVRALVAFFLTVIVAVPIGEAIGQHRAGDGRIAGAWRRLLDVPRAVVPAASARGRAAPPPSLWQLTVAANRLALAELAAFEDALEDGSVFGRSLRPPAQYVLSGWLGAGNERVYVGNQGWLFYRPDVEYVTGPPFLNPSWHRQRVAAASEWTLPPRPDPREAILDFDRQLRKLGATLVVMPTPLKASVHPELLASPYAGRRDLLQNPSYEPFVEGLRGAGVLVFDAAAVLVSPRQSGQLYLSTDTHWRPETVELVAEALAAFIREHIDLPDAAPADYRIDEREIRNLGDTAAMLDLPASQDLFPPETVWIRRVMEPGGQAWRPSPDADVLLLGDSFSNIYSLASMGWGDGAGLAEQLSFTLDRPIDRLVQNADGAFATREMLSRAGPSRLDGKRVIVWQFAARELAFGDWK